MARVSVFIDGFNLYYGLRKTPYKWLDLHSLCTGLVSNEDTVVAIKYFTARVRGTPDQPDAPVRQQVYLRALDSLPLVEIYFGRFSKQHKFMPLRFPPPRTVEVIKVEEKGSDVALATHMVAHAFRDVFDIAAMISNDSDLCPPMEMVQSLGKPVHIYNPQPATASPQIAKMADFSRPITHADLAGAQFPPVVIAKNGTQLLKPLGW
jgi:uncharacterized LabA/DUF88 family protein